MLEAGQEFNMSIAGVSGVSSSAYLQQSQNTAQTSTPSQAAAQTATLASSTASAGATQQPGQVHHHHHHGGGGAASDLTQTGTDAAGGTSLLNTVV
jgi:hypothetical protein